MRKTVYSRTLERADRNTTLVRDVVPARDRAQARRAGSMRRAGQAGPASGGDRVAGRRNGTLNGHGGNRVSETELYGLWHARHLVVEPDGGVIHRDPDGSLHLDEEEWRLLGVFSTEEAAKSQRERARELPGFRDEADCFDIAVLGLDHDLWTDGYVTAGPDGSLRD